MGSAGHSLCSNSLLDAFVKTQELSRTKGTLSVFFSSATELKNSEQITKIFSFVICHPLFVMLIIISHMTPSSPGDEPTVTIDNFDAASRINQSSIRYGCPCYAVR